MLRSNAMLRGYEAREWANICKTKPIKLLLDWITFCIKNIPWWNKNLLISEQRVFLSLSLSSDNYLTKDQSSLFPYLIFFTHPPLKMTWKCILYYQLNDCKSSWTNSVWSISALHGPIMRSKPIYLQSYNLNAVA